MLFSFSQSCSLLVLSSKCPHHYVISFSSFYTAVGQKHGYGPYRVQVTGCSPPLLSDPAGHLFTVGSQEDLGLGNLKSIQI